MIKKTKTDQSLMRFAEAWKDIDKKDIEAIKKNILDLRKKSTEELINQEDSSTFP